MSRPSSPTIALVLGDEHLLVQEAEAKLVAEVTEGRPSGLNHAVYTAESGGWAALEAAKTPPMMCRRKAVVLREMEKAPPELLEALLGYAEHPSPSATLILVGEKLPPASGGVDRGRRLENRLKEGGLVLRFKAQDQDPVSWALERARQAGVSLDRRAAALLVERVGADLGRLSTELDKAIAYVGGKGAVGEEEIERVTSLVAEAVIWRLTDAVLARDADRGLAAAHRLLEEGEPSHRLLAMVAWQIRQLLELQDCIQSGAGEPASLARMPHAKKAEARRALQQRPLSAPRILGALARANREMNRSPAGDRRVFEALILELTTR